VARVGKIGVLNHARLIILHACCAAATAAIPCRLYVYPESVTFQKYRNITCRVQVRLADGAVDGAGAKIMLGKSTSSAFTDHQYTQVNYHNYSPNFQGNVLLPGAGMLGIA